MKVNLKSLSPEEVESFVREAGLPRYRAGQLLHWMYERYATDLSGVTEFSKALRARLAPLCYVSNLEVVTRLLSADSTEKFLFRLEDGQTIESVLIPDGERLTLCVSSQVGCAMGCRFCATGRLGLIRNLKAFEVVDQAIAVNRLIAPEKKITNIVLMGMGEPLANFDEVVEALERFTSLLRISKRKITLSTSGLVPKIALLAKKAPEVNLAVSLNATTDSSREAIMPVNRKYPLKSLIEACLKFPLSPRRMITFEYVLIEGLNDSAEDARRLVKLLKKIRCKINLIPLNPLGAGDLKRPSDRRVHTFQKILTGSGLTALIRESRGRDIRAACGQLKAGYGQDRG